MRKHDLLYSLSLLLRLIDHREKCQIFVHAHADIPAQVLTLTLIAYYVSQNESTEVNHPLSCIYRHLTVNESGVVFA